MLEFSKIVMEQKKIFISHYWPDNAAFMDELGYKAEFYKLKDNKPSNNVLKKILFFVRIMEQHAQKGIMKTPNIEENFSIFILANYYTFSRY